jgi:pimeloyl-ACP methyl ester carboxylesterase
MAKVLRKLFWTAVAVTGGLAALNKAIGWSTPPLGNTLGGGFNRTAARYADMAYSVAGTGVPLLLLHALWPGNSGLEWERNFDAFSEHFTVYAPDFLGWGLSDKPQHIMRADDYTEQILHFVEDVIAAHESTPVIVIASSEACVFALLAAEERPELFSRIVLVCPSSDEEYSVMGERADARKHPIFQLLRLPVFGEALINFLTARTRLQSFLKSQLLVGEEAAGGRLLSQLHAASHQPGAGSALASRFAGTLGGNRKKAWESLPQQMLLVWGREARDRGLDSVPEWLALRPSADLEIIDEAKRLPHYEQADDFNAKVLKWLEK